VNGVYHNTLTIAGCVGRCYWDGIRLLGPRRLALRVWWGSQSILAKLRPAPSYPRKLNFGSGREKRPGYLNIDIDPASEHDLLIVKNDYSRLPRNYFDEVLAKDVVEHIPRANTVALLLDLADFLIIGGKLIVQTSSIVHVAAKIQETRKYADHHGWTICLFGNQAHPGDFHHSGFTEVTLRVLLGAAGFEIERWSMVDEWMFLIEAKKIFDWASLSVESGLSDQKFIERAFNQALFRPPTEYEHAIWRNALLSWTPRKRLLRTIFLLPERLYRFAESSGF
jgi:predicted SAM-dependent methyltransferase